MQKSCKKGVLLAWDNHQMQFSTNHLFLAEPAHFGSLLSKTFERVSQGVAVGKKGVGAKKRGRHVALIQSRCILANLIFDIIIVQAKLYSTWHKAFSTFETQVDQEQKQKVHFNKGYKVLFKSVGLGHPTIRLRNGDRPSVENCLADFWLNTDQLFVVLSTSADARPMPCGPGHNVDPSLPCQEHHFPQNQSRL